MFFCLWIPQFATWALEQTEPKLAQRPFVASQNGKVVAVSPLAYEAGVRAGMTNARAQSRLASLLVLARNPSCETLAWGEVHNALYGLTPQIESLSPGLLFADVEAEKMLPLMRQWNIYGGQAKDRATAHLAALAGERGSVLSIRPKGESPFVDRVPIEATLAAGISPKSLQRVKWFGWQTIGALRILSRRQLEEQIGSDGLTLFQLAQGPLLSDNLRRIPAWTPPEELKAAMTFEFPAREPCEWEGALDQLLTEVCKKLGPRSARTLEVRIETPLHPVAARRILKEPISQARLLGAPARSALTEALAILAPLPPIIVGIEIRLGALSSPNLQGSLFDGDKVEKTERPARIYAALKGMETRFAGKTGIYVPDQVDSPFSEEAWRWLPALEAARLPQVSSPCTGKPRTSKPRANKPKTGKQRKRGGG